ncbi:nucleotide sugar dehydrogenase [Micromonospora sp. CPCC 205539]|uniref:nucleotide sugar dehydrogenase n=1 Tax=Micromonospora sp. CPCC 205539 TaxID=3122408 RepID=UPI002FF41C72
MSGEHRAGGEDGHAVTIVGLGYVGLPLAVCFAAAGVRTLGVDTDGDARAAAAAGRPSFFEPGLHDELRALPPGALTFAGGLPDTPSAAVVICVGTPFDLASCQPDLRQLEAAVAAVAAHIGPQTLVVVRSTVPVGTCRDKVLSVLRTVVDEPLLAFCPERTIQGRALAEIRSLPQVVGALDERSRERARALFDRIAPDQVHVSSLEAAELVKLACNAHTDLIYGFGNELATLAEHLRLDANEVIRAANVRYPRPDLARPGFVGGSCLTKDPYLLVHSGEAVGYRPPMVAAARKVNENVPVRAAQRVLGALAVRQTPVEECKVFVCGVAYKSRPATDDVRGAASEVIARELGAQVGLLVAHDFLVPAERTASIGFKPVDLEEGLRDSDALILLTDHPGYADLTPQLLRAAMRPDPVVFDMWGVLADRLSDAEGVDYLRLGRG